MYGRLFARVLKERDTAGWRDKALTELKDRLSEKEKQIESKKWRDPDKADINMSKSAAIQLESIIGDLYRQSPEDVDTRCYALIHSRLQFNLKV